MLNLIDCNETNWQHNASQMLESGREPRFINFRAQDNDEFVYELRALGHSKCMPLPKFEGIFDTSGMPFNVLSR